MTSFVKGQILSAAELNAAIDDAAANSLQSIGLYTVAMPAGDVWLTVNAKWDGASWQRIDVTKYAYAIVFQAFSSIPGEEAFGGNTAIMLLRATPASNPIGTMWSVGGWENMAIFDQFRHIVIGGEGMEMDGSGVVPYGRVVHAIRSGTTRTGVLSNMYIDFSGVDDNTQPSWFAGRKNDSFVVERAPAGGTTYASLAGLLLLDAFGDLALAGNLTVPGGNVIFSGLVAAANDAAAATAGVSVGGLYQASGVVRVRLT